MNFKKEIRVLRVEDSEVSSPNDHDPYSYYYERNLYADIMPDISGIVNPKTKGICHVGWRNQDCPTFTYDAGSSILQTKVLYKNLNMILFLTTVVIVMLY